MKKMLQTLMILITLVLLRINCEVVSYFLHGLNLFHFVPLLL
jgi:hypothetical protein